MTRDEKLRLILAKLLPDVVYTYEYEGQLYLFWKTEHQSFKRDEVRETEYLYLCRLAESSLTNEQWDTYIEMNPDYSLQSVAHACWRDRVSRLGRTKNIKI